ncbi:MAG: prepilin-type N-terminal cleavage/methylation domain-containing protein [Steroidobacteraceae bacterium]
MRRLNEGFTLIETLVALGVSAIAALGMALLLQQALVAQGRAEREQRAALLGSQIAESMAANAGGRAAYARASSDPIPVAEPCANTASCDASALARTQVRGWLLQLAAQWPGPSEQQGIGIRIDDVANGASRIQLALHWPENDATTAHYEELLWLAPTSSP